MSKSASNITIPAPTGNFKSMSVAKWINTDFFNNYGHPDDEDTFIAKSKLLMVCHAKSQENEFNDNN